MYREWREGYVTTVVDDWLVDIEAFNVSDISVWSTTVNLEDYDLWSEWIIVEVDTPHIAKITFYATGAYCPNTIRSLYPSVDNLIIAEPLSNDPSTVPEPAIVVLLGLA